MRDNFDNFLKGLVDLSSNHCETQENPKAIITIGEDGSGKEVIALQAQDELSKRGGSVLVGSNYFKPHTENYIKNVKSDDKSTSISSENEAKHISDKVLEHAIDNKHNIVINENSENPYEFKKTTEKLKDSGYEVELRAVATPHEHSLLRKNLQYENQKGNFGFGDHKDIKTFDIKGMDEILDIAETKNLVDKTKVYDRVGNEVYSNELNQDHKTWFKAEKADEAFQFEQNKPLGKSEYQYNQVAWEQLVHMKMSAHAPKDEVNKTILEKEANQNPEHEKNGLDKNKNISDLIVKSPESFKGVQKGEIVENAENSVLMRINRFTAIKYPKDRLSNMNDQDLEVGQQLFMNHGLQGELKVMEQQEIQHYESQENQLQQTAAEQGFEKDMSR